MQLIDLINKNRFDELKISERELSDLLFRYWDTIFPDLSLIQREFTLKGEVRNNYASGRIDFFAYNKKHKRFVIIELKTDYDKNIRNQIFDYVDFVEDNFSYILLKSKQIIPDIKINNKSIELILISKQFKTNDYKRIQKIHHPTRLITYRLFQNHQILLDQFDNFDVKKLKETENHHNINKGKFNDDLKFFWQTFIELKDKNIIHMNEDYKIEGNELIVRLGKVHEHYTIEQLNKNTDYFSLNYLREKLKNSNAFMRIIKSVRFGDNVTSAYVFDKRIIDNEFKQ